MSCDHLICARCSRPVSEGRCPSCRAARAELHQQGPASIRYLLIAAAVLILTLILAVKFGAR